MASTSDSSTTSIIKSDRIGRSRYTATFKAEVLAAYEQSGMRGPAFAKQCGIKYPTFAAWVLKAKQKSETRPPADTEQRFILAEMGESGREAVLKVELPGGAIARVAHQKILMIRIAAE